MGSSRIKPNRLKNGGYVIMTINIRASYIQTIDLLVANGYEVSRSEFMRKAVKMYLEQVMNFEDLTEFIDQKLKDLKDGQPFEELKADEKELKADEKELKAFLHQKYMEVEQ